MGNELREQDNHKQMRTITLQSVVAHTQIRNFDGFSSTYNFLDLLKKK